MHTRNHIPFEERWDYWRTAELAVYTGWHILRTVRHSSMRLRQFILRTTKHKHSVTSWMVDMAYRQHIKHL